MLLDKRFLFGVLNGSITVYFTKVTKSEHRKFKKVVDLKEHNIRLLENPKANCKYGVVEVLTARPIKIKNVSDGDIKRGGYKNREDFINWCKDNYHLLSEDDEIGIAEIEVHALRWAGRKMFTDLGLVIPKIRW